jgi:hypothetical protein
MTRIDDSYFTICLLKAICILWNVDIIGNACFSWCREFSLITLETESRLLLIDDLDFKICESLKSMFIPRNVELLGKWCFANKP